MFKVKKCILLLIAGIVWLAAGINILRIGIQAIFSSWGKGALWLDITLPIFTFLIFVGFCLMFYRIVTKHEKRILGYKADKVSVFLFFDLKGYLLMVFMMALGLFLRHGGFLPDYFFAFFYTGLGTALSLAGFRFAVRFFKLTLRQILWIVVGMISVGLGTLGIFLPLIPTVPLYLLAAFAFLSGSQTLHNKFKKSKLYGHYLQPYLDAGGLTKKIKISLTIFVSLQIAIAAYFLQNSILGLLLIGILYLGFLISMAFVVKTVSPAKITRNHKEK